jgi:hypothetical protein
MRDTRRTAKRYLAFQFFNDLSQRTRFTFSVTSAHLAKTADRKRTTCTPQRHGAHRVMANIQTNERACH